MSKKRNYIIYAFSFSETSGGIIALHQLCHLLNEAGENAYIWPGDPNILHINKPYQYLKSHITHAFYKLKGCKYQTFPAFNTPIATQGDLVDAVVIYPEVVPGNPLSSNCVVRWFLNKPGYFTGETVYGSNELYFFYNPHFDDKALNLNSENKLKTLFIKDDIYHQTNKFERKGTCYILRKGIDRRIIHDLSDSILVDSLSHEEIAKVFNEVELCISYDTQTMLSKYAAMCGCTSIVIPDEGVSKEEWRPKLEDRYGIAYGFEDTQWAIETKDKVLEDFKRQAELTKIQVEEFILKTHDFFLK